MSTSQRPSYRAVIRDTFTWIGGWALIFKQAGILFAPPAHPSEILIGAAVIMIGVPGGVQVWQGLSGSRAGTPGSPPPPASAQSSPSSSGGQ